MTFLPMLPSGNENSTQVESNTITTIYISGSAFLANLTPPNRQCFKVKLEFKSRDHASNV